MKHLTGGLGILLFVLSAAAQAHKPSDSYLHLRVDGERIQGHWDIALRDLDLAVGLDRNSDNAIDWGEVRAGSSDIDAYAVSHLGLSSAGSHCPLAVTDHLIDHHTDGAYAVLMLEGQCAAAIANLEVDYSLLFDLDAQHRGLLHLERGAGTMPIATAVFPKDHSRQAFAMDGGSSGWRNLGGFIADGVRHIAIGYDHVLFLVALLLPAVLRRRDGRWIGVDSLRAAFWNIAAMVTAFTVAHSITLSMATLGWINLPSRLVESAIALSVLLTALDNLFAFLPRRRWLVAFAFGLLHGFGFASVLRDLALPRADLALSLFGFNLGVEIGQLAIVLVLAPTAFLLRNRSLYPRYILGMGSLAIGLLAGTWLIERSLGLRLLPL
ncbi:MAG TPA: HupE/UreJ family protein [Dokdonella sp.]|nr:HupE/UreJ family protein [Dokdonella sp.]